MDKFAIFVEGAWDIANTRSVKNKLQIYFQSKKKSHGGPCRVEIPEENPGRAIVCFDSEDVRASVLAKDNHEITLSSGTVTLLVALAGKDPKQDSQPIPKKNDKGTELPKCPLDLKGKPDVRADAADKYDKSHEEPLPSLAVVENISDATPLELLSVLVENLSRANEEDYSLEVIYETKVAVVTFKNQADLERFLTASQKNVRFQNLGLAARQLERTGSIRVESLRMDPALVKDMLELYFEKQWGLPKSIKPIPEEEAAIVTFDDVKFAEIIPQTKYHRIGKAAATVYPYYDSLGSALYGKDRPTWKMPEPFTENVDHAIWKFLLMKKQLSAINNHMKSHFCVVDMDKPEVKLSPLPGFLRQRGLTERQVNGWMDQARNAFCTFLNDFVAFGCSVQPPAWKMAEKEVRSIVKEDAILMMDASRGILTIASRQDKIKQIREPIERIVHKAMSQIERQRDGMSEDMKISPAMHYMMMQEGLEKEAMNISPEMKLCYQADKEQLSISGLPSEVYKMKAWILGRAVERKRKPLDMDPQILEFLKSVDCMKMSHDLFTSQGISAVYSLEGGVVSLTGSSERSMDAADQRLKIHLTVQSMLVEDQEVLQMPDWESLNKNLIDTYNSSTKKTVAVQVQRGATVRISVSGFISPVKEISQSLWKFITDNSRSQEVVRVKTRAVAEFIKEKRAKDWADSAKNYNVKVDFYVNRRRITLSGCHLYVQRAKTSLQKMADVLYSEEFSVDKPGAKKYFQQDGRKLLSSVLKDLDCVVMLREGNEEEEDDDEVEDLGGSRYCEVRTHGGILVIVSIGDICKMQVDAIVNAANEDLKHIGGLAFAVLKGAGPQLQKLSDDHINRYGRLQAGDAILTDGCSLPCKYVIHAVGPRFTDFEQNTSVKRLKLAIKESLRQAAMSECSTIAIPAVSSGIFGFPLDLCAETIALAVREYCDLNTSQTFLTEIHLVDNNDATVRALARAVNSAFNDLKPKMTIPKHADPRSGGFPSWNPEKGARGRGQQHSQAKPGHSSRGRGNWKKEAGRGAAGGKAVAHGPQSGHHDASSETRGGHLMTDDDGVLATKHTQEGLRIVLQKGNIQDQSSDVIVNTIAENGNLNQGAVSKAILSAAGPQLQSAVNLKSGGSQLGYGDVVVTDGFNLKCQKVFHSICPYYGTRLAEEELIKVIRLCLHETEKLQLSTLSFPALGTGNLKFPRAMVSRIILEEIEAFSRKCNPAHLRTVYIVVHPSDAETVACFLRDFRGQAQPVIRPAQRGAHQTSPRPSPVQPQHTGSFGAVSSPSLGMYRMQMGQLTLEVSSGDITKETCDVIVNSSNASFTLKTGVSKAILDGAGPTVEQECSDNVSSSRGQRSSMIHTSGGLLPAKSIIHIAGSNDPATIKEIVYSVLKYCEDNQLSSVAFPALGTGQGGAKPSAVADSMIDGVVDLVRKKQPRNVRLVKILIFQTAMVNDFHASMKKRQGEAVEEKSVFTKVKEGLTSFTSLFKSSPTEGESSGANNVILEKEEFEPAVFQLCAANPQAMNQAKLQIDALIVKEHIEGRVTNKCISQLSKAEVDQLKALQRNLSVSIKLDKTPGQEPTILIEGLTRDVLTAERTIRDMIQEVERKKNHEEKALLLSGTVEWSYVDSKNNGTVVPFDIYTNYALEMALEKKESVDIKIHNEKHIADVQLKEAIRPRGNKRVELIRRDPKDDVPGNWEDMRGQLVKRVLLPQGSQDYMDVEKEFRKTGLKEQIISIERIQNPCLWQQYQIMKKQMEIKNGHTNNERQLFHGTSPNVVDIINNKGFDRNYAGTSTGAACGMGSYFAVDPAYSARGYAKPDASGHKPMYLARVLVGDFCKGSQGLYAPPAKSSGNGDSFDSTCDNVSNPKMFVSFKDPQAYPEYLITFQ